MILLVHAWAIPELYANRGAKVVKPRGRAGDVAEVTALGLLGDLVGHEARALHARTGLVLERGALGVWLVGEAGALLVRGRGRRVHCWCVRVPEPALPSSDRIAHLLLALRADERGFATVANHAFAGARWRVRRRLPSACAPRSTPPPDSTEWTIGPGEHSAIGPCRSGPPGRTMVGMTSPTGSLSLAGLPVRRLALVATAAAPTPPCVATASPACASRTARSRAPSASRTSSELTIN